MSRELLRSPKILHQFYDVLSMAVTNRSVVDFGTWDLASTEHLVMLGAEEVWAIDKEPCPYEWLHRRVRFTQTYFEYLALEKTAPYDVAFVSWPNVYNVAGLREHLEQFSMVVYIGSNVRGNQCGSYDMWDHFFHRKVLHYDFALSGTLIVYGDLLDEPRDVKNLYHEEYVNIKRRILYQDSDYAYPVGTRDPHLWGEGQF